MQVGLPPNLGESPAGRLSTLQDLIGAEAIMAWCAGLLLATTQSEDPSSPSITWLGGEHAAEELAGGGFDRPGQEYWPRVWAARGLFHVWTPGPAATVATRAIVAALTDPAWRVREMAAKVTRRWLVGDAADALVPLLADSTPRVRVAAASALGVVGEFEHAHALKAGLDDEEDSVRKAAAIALDHLGLRLDRSLEEA
jgi:hypothetical protein